MKNSFRAILSTFIKNPKVEKQLDTSKTHSKVDLNSDYPSKVKAEIFEKIKQEFQPAKDAKSAIGFGREAVRSFILNHSLEFNKFESEYVVATADVSDEKLESWLRKGMSREYKKRSNLTSKCRSIFYAQKHIELVLALKDEAVIHSGFKRLCTSLADEEYIPNLLRQLYFYSESFKDVSLRDKVNALFKTLASRKYALINFKKGIAAYDEAKTPSEKHFSINGIVSFLARKVKYNPQAESQLIEWCEKDIMLYQEFLRYDAELHFSSMLPFEEVLSDPDKPKKLAAMMRFSDVKELEGYFVPRLPSFDALVDLYKAKGDHEKLIWLGKLSKVIGYRFDKELVPVERYSVSLKEVDFSKITKTIEVKKSGNKGKLAFLDSRGNECSTEDAFVDAMQNEGWNVIRAEVSFWQALFCLFYFEEIFEGPVKLIPPNDIPADMFSAEEFYVVRKPLIDRKHKELCKIDISSELKSRIRKYKNASTRLLDFGPKVSFVEVFSDKKVSDFLDAAGSVKVAQVLYRLAKNLGENRAGVTDFVIWRDDEVKFVEVKRQKEKVRESQINWLKWYLEMGFDVSVYRLKPV